MYDTYELRFAEFCRRYHLDPQDGRSVALYEEEWEEQESGDSDAEWRPGYTGP